MASMLDKVDPEGAKKLEQFPDFFLIQLKILNEYKVSLDKAMESNADSVKSYYGACASIIESLQKKLKMKIYHLRKRNIFDRNA